MMPLDFKDYDQRGYRTVDVGAGYSSWAHSYEAKFDDSIDLLLLNRLKSVDWAKVKTAADLACGTGRTGAWLVGKGVQQLDGVDLTEEMLGQARQRNIYRTLINEDIRKTSLPSENYDLVMNSLAAEHLPELEPLYTEAFRMLRPGGCFLLLGYHPEFQLRGIPTHFKHHESGEPIAIENYIHLLSDYVKAGFASGFTLLELDENVVGEGWPLVSPSKEKHVGHPITFAGVWRKP